jgi:hypothetical protein
MEVFERTRVSVCTILTFVFQKMLHQAVETLMQDGIEQELDNDIREMRALIDSVRK